MNHFTTDQFRKRLTERYFADKYMDNAMTDTNEIIHALRLWFQGGDSSRYMCWMRSAAITGGSISNPVISIMSLSSLARRR